MTHILELFDPSEYVAAFELQGQDHTVTISRVVGGQVIGEDGKTAKKPIVYFSDWPKPLVLGKKMAKTLIKLYGPDPKAYTGRQLTMYPTTEKCFGEMMEVVRLRPNVRKGAQAPQQQPKPSASTADRVKAVVDAIKAMKTIEGVEKAYGRADKLLVELEQADDGASIDRITEAREERLRELESAE